MLPHPNPDNHDERAKHVGRKQAVSITLDGEDLTFIDQGIQYRIFQNRSHAVAWALQLLRQHVAALMRHQQQEARRLEELARRSSGSPAPPSQSPPPGPGNPGFPPRSPQ